MLHLLKRLTKTCLASAGYQVTRLCPTGEVQDRLNELLPLVVSQRASQSPDFVFVQVGGFDGVTGDPIHHFVRRFGWRGVICEPEPTAFARLQANYRDYPLVKLENVAIDTACGSRPFYYVGEGGKNLPGWVYQLGSFRPGFITQLSTGVTGIEELVKVREVTCVTLAELFGRHNLGKVDLLQIDTEGYDFEILKTVPFDLFKPNIIHFEHRHLSREDRADSTRLLLLEGYQVALTQYDTLAFLNNQWAGRTG